MHNLLLIARYKLIVELKTLYKNFLLLSYKASLNKDALKTTNLKRREANEEK
jgi:hypothetical protein